MRHFKLLLLFVMCAAVPAFAQNFTTGLYYDLRSNKPSAVALTKVGQMTNVLGKGISIDIDAFVGINADKGIFGTSFGRRFPIANEVTGYLGVGTSWSFDKPFKDFTLGPVAGITWRF